MKEKKLQIGLFPILMFALLFALSGLATADEKGHPKEGEPTIAKASTDNHTGGNGTGADICSSMENLMAAGKQHSAGTATPHIEEEEGIIAVSMKSGGMKMKPGMKMDKAHQVHGAQNGGVLFMAPNKFHHIEGVYSQECGFQLFLYDEFTKPIMVGEFQGFIKITKEDDDGEEVEMIRFLVPASGHTYLQGPADRNLKGPFDVELYVKFPGQVDPEIFNFRADEHTEFHE